MLFEPIARDIARHLEQESGRISHGMLSDLRDTAAQWKPAGYDEHMLRRRLYYEGRSTPFLQEAMAKRYQTTWQDMSLMSLNLVRLIAEVDASVYDYEAIRYLVDSKGERLDRNDENARAFEDLKNGSGLDSSMVETERRLMVCDTLPARGWWEPLRGQFSLQPFWPNDVSVIPHPRRPHDPRYWLSLIARIAGPNGLNQRNSYNRRTDGTYGTDQPKEWFEVWWRSWAGDDPRTGAPRFGSWHRDIVADDGSTYEAFGTARTEWAIGLPWIFLQNGIPEGCPWNWQNHDLIENVNAINVTWSNIFFILDMEAHDELVLTSGGTPKEHIKGGPNRVHQLKIGEALGTVSRNPKIRELLEVVRDYMRALAITRRQSEDAYSWERGAPMTGVSRRIKNEPQEKARREHAKQRKREEEEYLIPMMLEFSDEFGTTDFAGAGVRGHMLPRELPSYEDPMQKQLRAVEAYKVGAISLARFAAEADWYPDEETAASAGLSTDIEAQPHLPTAERQPLDKPAQPEFEEEGL